MSTRGDASRQKHRADIDGLRAVAIVPVVLFHAGVSAFRGGFVGVDVFFVISGYLISSLILNDLAKNQFSFLEFWMRRARRILPALFVVVTVTLVASWFILFPTAYKDLGRSAAAQAVFVSNVFFWLKSGYFAAPSETKPLLHTWTLSVEEQYYLVIPLTLFLLVRYVNRYREWVIGALLLASFVISAWSVRLYPDAAFYLIHTRAWELLTGSMLALYAIRHPSGGTRPQWVYESLAVLGLLSILFAVLTYSSATPFPGFAALAPVLGAAAIIWANHGRTTVVGRMLSHPWPVWIGLISYSLYLWHWPLLALARYSMTEQLPVTMGLAISVASAFIAWLSYRFVETPVRQKPIFRRYSFVMPSAAAALAVMFVAGVSINATSGAAGRPAFQVTTFDADVTPSTRRNDLCSPVTSVSLPDGFVCRLGPVSNAKPKLLLIGDSFAGMYLPAFQNLAVAHDQEVWFIKDPNRNLYAGVLELVSSQKPSTVVLAYSWKRALKNGIPELVPPASTASDSAPAGLRGRIAARFGFDPVAMVGDTRSEFRSNLERLVKTLTDRGIDVWLIDSPPYYPVSVPLKLGLIAKQHGNPVAYGSQLGVHLSEMSYIHDVFKEMPPKARVINVTDVLCDSTKFCRTYSDGHSLYSDDAHLSDFGVMQVAPLLNRIFEQSHEVRLSGCRTKPCVE